MAKVVVVGAGMGGLAAAARLAAVGHAVTICEQSLEVGGKLARWTHRGFTFDTGPSLVTMPQVFEDLFAAAGGSLRDAVDLIPVEPIARYRFADGTVLDASADLDRFTAALDTALGPGAGRDWRSFMVRAGAIHAAVREPFLESPLSGVWDLVRLSMRVRDLITIAPWLTLRDLGQRELRDPRLRMLLDRYATYTGSDPRRAPAALASVPYAEQTFGAWYVRGGLYRLAEAVRDLALARGATLRLGADVERIETTGGRVTGVHLAGGDRLPAELVVANTDAAHLYGGLIDGSVAVSQRRRLQRAPASLSGFALLLGIRGRTPGLAHHTVLFPADYDAEFDALFGPRPQPVADPTLYLSVPDDPATAPPDCEAWFVLVNAPRQDQVDWRTPGMASAYADRLLDLLAERGLVIRERLAFCEVRTPADLADRTRAAGGAIYGTSSNGLRAAFLRPANRSPVPGLFLVGGSAHPGGGLPLVTLSARIVAGLIGSA